MAGSSFAVLQKDPELLLFPLLSLVMSLAAFAGWVYALIVFDKHLPDNDLTLYGELFVFYLAVSLIATFWDVAMLTSARQRLEGGDPNFGGGVAMALRHLPAVVAWALLHSTVGVLLAFLERRLKESKFAAFLGDLAEDAMEVATFFAVPVMIFEGQGPFEALSRSTQIIRKTWGESLTGYFGLGALRELLMLPAVLILVAVFAINQGVLNRNVWIALGLAILYLIAVGIYLSALENVYRAAIYLYAAEGKAVSGFELGGTGFSPTFQPSKKHLLQVPAGEFAPPPVTSIACARCFEPMAAQHVDGVTVDTCSRCGGMWLDRDEPAKLAAARSLPVQPVPREDVQFRREGQRECPRCNELLKVHTVDGVRVDACPTCRGMFLDPGELKALSGS